MAMLTAQPESGVPYLVTPRDNVAELLKINEIIGDIAYVIGPSSATPLDDMEN
jgi:hypothetical protein